MNKYIPHTIVTIIATLFALYIHSHTYAVMIASMSLFFLLALYVVISVYNDHRDWVRLQIMAIRAESPYQSFVMVTNEEGGVE